MIFLINFCVFILLHPFITAAVILIGLYFVIVGTIGELGSDTQNEGFNYGSIDMWEEKYPSCAGNRQSPIDLNSRYFKIIKNHEDRIIFHGYDNMPIKMKLINSGHSLALKATWLMAETPYFTGGPLNNNEYVFEQLHFHWGSTDNAGSEHTVNLQSFPLEMHMVHYNRKYGSIKNATEHEDGLSVIGVFFDIQLDGSKGLQNILQEISSVAKPKSRVAIKPFLLTEFHGVTTTNKYASYQGSLTTPPCSEVVTWIFPILMLDVTKAQMETIRLMQLNNDDTHNNRPVQPTNNRNVSIYKFEN